MMSEADQDYAIYHVEKKSDLLETLVTGWFPVPIPTIYESEELCEYREWLDADCYEANLGIGGLFESGDITDYYMYPVEMRYGRTIDFDYNEDDPGHRDPALYVADGLGLAGTAGSR